MNHIIKVLLIILLIIIIISGSGIFTQQYLKSSSQELEKYITAIEGYTASNDWYNAGSNLLHIKDLWFNIKKPWSVLIDHQEIDNIDVTLSRMEKFIQFKDTSSAMAEASALIKYVKHIPIKEAPSLENIF